MSSFSDVAQAWAPLIISLITALGLVYTQVYGKAKVRGDAAKSISEAAVVLVKQHEARLTRLEQELDEEQEKRQALETVVRLYRDGLSILIMLIW